MRGRQEKCGRCRMIHGPEDRKARRAAIRTSTGRPLRIPMRRTRARRIPTTSRSTANPKNRSLTITNRFKFSRPDIVSGLFVCERKSCRNMSVDVYPSSSLQFGCRCDTHHRFSGGACDNLGPSPEGMVCLQQFFELLLAHLLPFCFLLNRFPKACTRD